MKKRASRLFRRMRRTFPRRPGLVIAVLLLAAVAGLTGARLHRVSEQLMVSGAMRWGGLLLAECAGAGMEAAGGGLTQVEKGPDGEIQMVSVDEGKLHALRTAAMEEAGALLVEGGYTASIPLGSLFFGEFFTGGGPGLPLRYIPDGAVTIFCESEAESAGINQTAYRVVMKMSLQVTAVTAFARETVTVPYETVAAEVLVVGDVPVVYAYGGEIRETP